MFRKVGLQLRFGIATVGIALLAVAAVVAVQGWSGSRTAREEAVARSEATAGRSAAELNLVFTRAMSTARALASTLEGLKANKGASRKAARFILESVLVGAPEFRSVWTAWDPLAFDGDNDEAFRDAEGHDATGRFVSCYTRVDGKILLEPRRDYTQAKGPYAAVREAGAEILTDPYPYTAGHREEQVVSAVVPIRSEGAVVGAIGVDVPIALLQKAIAEIRPYGTGWSSLISASGTFACSGDTAQIGKSFLDLGDREQRRTTLDELARGQPLTVVERDEQQRLDVVRSYVPFRVGAARQTWVLNVNAPEKDALSNAHRLTYLSVGIGLVAGLLSLFLGAAMARAMIRPIQLLTVILGRFARGDVADRGDAGAELGRLAASRGDELGAMAQSLSDLQSYLTSKGSEAEQICSGNLGVRIVRASEQDQFGQAFAAMADGLQSVVTQIRQAVDLTNSGAGRIAGASRTLNRGATQQQESLQTITSSMATIGSQAEVNAQKAMQASALAGQAKAAADKGNSEVSAMVGAMAEIQQASAQIASIVKLIDDIAFQTNLLALNAAVEAARAGGHGKGFAVVAEEVRNLAGRSAKAAMETGELIQATVKKVENGTVIAKRTEAALQEITQDAVKVADLVGEIAAASNEQAKGVGQVSQGLKQIDQVTQQNTANAAEASAAAQALSGEAEELRLLVSRFRLEGDSEIVDAQLEGSTSE